MGKVVKFSDLFRSNGDGTYTPLKNIYYKKWPFRTKWFLQSDLRVEGKKITHFVGRDLMVEYQPDGSVEIKGIS